METSSYWQKQYHGGSNVYFYCLQIANLNLDVRSCKGKMNSVKIITLKRTGNR